MRFNLYCYFLCSYITFTIKFKNCDGGNLYDAPIMKKICINTSAGYNWNVYNDDTEKKIIPNKVLKSHCDQVCMVHSISGDEKPDREPTGPSLTLIGTGGLLRILWNGVTC